MNEATPDASDSKQPWPCARKGLTRRGPEVRFRPAENQAQRNASMSELERFMNVNWTRSHNRAIFSITGIGEPTFRLTSRPPKSTLKKCCTHS
jgi:hypothetical protein